MANPTFLWWMFHKKLRFFCLSCSKNILKEKMKLKNVDTFRQLLFSNFIADIHSSYDMINLGKSRVPATQAEIRALCIRCLCLNPNQGVLRVQWLLHETVTLPTCVWLRQGQSQHHPLLSDGHQWHKNSFFVHIFPKLFYWSAQWPIRLSLITTLFCWLTTQVSHYPIIVLFPSSTYTSKILSNLNCKS